MFGSIGITEIIIMAGIALVVMGPEKFPDFARTVARMVRDVRGYVADAQRDLEREMRPVKKELDELAKIDPEAYIDQLAKSAMGEDKDKDEDKEDEDDQYNPEPEGPTVDGTHEYGDIDSASDEQAQEEDSAGDSSGEEGTGIPEPEGPEGTELYRD